MTPRERLQAVLRGEIPDCVAVAPDFSNMIPARRTGKPFWDLYLYQDPPIWEAYIGSAKHYDIDSLMDGYFPLSFPEETACGPAWERFIVFRSPERIITQASYVEDGKRVWAPTVAVYYAFHCEERAFERRGNLASKKTSAARDCFATLLRK